MKKLLSILSLIAIIAFGNVCAYAQVTANDLVGKTYEGSGNGGGMPIETTVEFQANGKCMVISNFYYGMMDELLKVPSTYKVSGSKVILTMPLPDDEPLTWEFTASKDGTKLSYDNSEPEMGNMGLDYQTLNLKDSVKVVVNAKGEVLGRLVKENSNSYTVETQDEYDVPKNGNKVVAYSPENGQGFVYSENPGKVNVRSTPSTSGSIVGTIMYEEGDLPETFQCLGKENGWYKISINGKTGYVRQDLVKWDAIDTF